jgi:hypothetical protein
MRATILIKHKIGFFGAALRYYTTVVLAEIQIILLIYTPTF